MANIQYYDVILAPVVTEKSMDGMATKRYTFLVHPEANKTQKAPRPHDRPYREDQEGLYPAH